jgi:hypothetical protein
MQSFIDGCRAAPAFSRLTRLLGEIVESPALHARFLNSLSLLEYIGVRKMLKARRAEEMDLAGLQHVLEEAVHSTRLKKFAHKVAPSAVSVEGFGPEHTLAGEAAEDYFQAVDRAAATALGGADGEACYALTSAAIEIRARCLYPAYQTILSATGSVVSVASILADEEQHLAEMTALLPARVPHWQTALARVMQEEARAFDVLLDALESTVSRRGGERAAANAGAATAGGEPPSSTSRS